MGVIVAGVEVWVRGELEVECILMEDDDPDTPKSFDSVGTASAAAIESAKVMLADAKKHYEGEGVGVLSCISNMRRVN